MRRALRLLVVSAMMLLARRAAACGPWEDTPTLRSTATRAGLVVAAHRTDATLTLQADDRFGEAFATFEVDAVLKGQPLGRRIVVATRWLRAQGVEVSPGGSAMLFLERSGDRYHPVGHGDGDDCTVRTLPVAQGKVLLADVPVPFEVLARELGFAWAEAPPSSSPTGAPPLVIFAIACGGAGFALGHRVARAHAAKTR